MSGPVVTKIESMVVSRQRAQDASRREKRTEEGYGLSPYWLYCGLDEFMEHLRSVEEQKGIVHERRTERDDNRGVGGFYHKPVVFR